MNMFIIDDFDINTVFQLTLNTGQRKTDWLWKFLLYCYIVVDI